MLKIYNYAAEKHLTWPHPLSNVMPRRHFVFITCVRISYDPCQDLHPLSTLPIPLILSLRWHQPSSAFKSWKEVEEEQFGQRLLRPVQQVGNQILTRLKVSSLIGLPSKYYSVVDLFSVKSFGRRGRWFLKFVSDAHLLILLIPQLANLFFAPTPRFGRTSIGSMTDMFPRIQRHSYVVWHP